MYSIITKNLLQIRNKKTLQHTQRTWRIIFVSLKHNNAGKEKNVKFTASIRRCTTKKTKFEMKKERKKSRETHKKRTPHGQTSSSHGATPGPRTKRSPSNEKTKEKTKPGWTHMLTGQNETKSHPTWIFKQVRIRRLMCRLRLRLRFSSSVFLKGWCMHQMPNWPFLFPSPFP